MFNNTEKIHHLPSHPDQDLYFKIHAGHHNVDKQADEGGIVELKEETKPEVTPEPAEKRTIKSIFHDAGRQILASIIFLAIGFLLLNWSAYYQIAKSRWEDFTGVDKTSPLEQLVTDPILQDPNENQLLSVNDTVLADNNGVPALDLEVTPLDSRIIIPRINQNIPIVRVSSEALIKKDWGALEAEMQKALQHGVVHYPGTSLPGQTGNIVVTGHSSYFPWDPGRFKDVFALLHNVVVGDKIVVYYKQDKYLYEVDEIKTVLPEDVSVLKQSPQNKLTLITCTPVGTNLKRLIVTAVPVAKNNQPIENNNAKISR